MRSPVAAIALCVSLMPLPSLRASAQFGDAGIVHPSAASVPAQPPDNGSEAALRHAKRTACLKQARAKKLVGAARDAFVKECVAAH